MNWVRIMKFKTFSIILTLLLPFARLSRQSVQKCVCIQAPLTAILLKQVTSMIDLFSENLN